jgi:hypothetical protein
MKKKEITRVHEDRKAFPDPLRFENAGMRGSSRCFRLTHKFRYISSKGTIAVPVGFITDGASIPKAFWSILSPFGDYFAAAVIHDYLYSPVSIHKFTRAECDLIFKEAMFNDGVPWYRRDVIYRTVANFGKCSFKKTPQDITISVDFDLSEHE